MPKTRVEFINLAKTGADLASAAARLAAYHAAAGKRVLLLAHDQEQAQNLDARLWDFDPASFVPHNLAGGPDQANEPVLIGLSPAAPNRAQVLIMASPLDDPPLADYQLIIDFVPPDQEGSALALARARYKAFSGNQAVDLFHLTDLP